MDSKNNIQCVQHVQQLFHLKSIHGKTTCLGIKQQKGKAHSVVQFNCDSNLSEMQWIKWVSKQADFLIYDAFHICQSLDQMTCLSIYQDSQNGNNIVQVASYLDDGYTFTKYQQWRLNPKTNQLVNVGTGTCLTSFDSKPLSNTLADRLLPVGLTICTRGATVTMKQKWVFTPLPKC